MPWLERRDRSATVLIVDDDPECRDTLADVLQAEGFTIWRAENGQEALERLRSGPLPCVILLELMMPVMDGWEFRKHQKQDVALASIPVVVVSGIGDTERNATSVDAADYLEKPFTLSKLIETVARYC